MSFDGESSGDNFNIATRDDPEFDFPIIPEQTEKALDDLHGRAHDDYETWKRDFLEWLYYEGKKPDKAEGFASATIRKTSYRTGQLMRTLWEKRGYTTELSPDDADEIMRYLGRHSDYEDSNLSNIVKAIKRVFKYYNHEKGKNIEWSCNYAISEPDVTNRDYFRQEEFQPLYEAALNHGAVKHYHNCSVEERDQLKIALSQRFNKPKENIAPHDFERANSFKIPSIVATTLDMGLRPIEVARATTDWIDLKDEVVRIPAAESSKNEDNWECVLSSNAVRALEKWLEERRALSKYDNTNKLWLNNRTANTYRSATLNYLLDDLIETSPIEPAGRDLTWYSIRHGVATVWVREEDIQDAQEQLRHEKVDTTLNYAHSGVSTRKSAVNSKY